MLKRIVSFVLAVLLLCGLLPQMGIEAQAVTFALDAQQLNGREFSSVYGEKLNNVFRGEVQLFHDSDVRLPLGTSMKTGTSYNVAGIISGYQCYIYAQAVYYYLFGDVVYHGTGYKYWSNSQRVLHNKTVASYEVFKQAGVGFGAYIRTTTSKTGAYNGDKGHSLIVLAYNEETITYLEGNADGKGLVRVTEMTWAEFDESQLSGRGRRIAHVVQCIDAACGHASYSPLGVCENCGAEYDFAYRFAAANREYYIVIREEGADLKAQLPYREAQTQLTLTYNDRVELLGRVKNAFGETWLQVSFDGQTGYVAEADLMEDPVTPGKPVLHHAREHTDAEPAVFTWADTANTTHYDLHLEVKDDEGQWQAHTQLEDTESGVSVELEEGQYRVELRAYNAQAQMCYTSADAAYLDVAHSHVFEVVNRTEATCSAAGIVEYICADCGESSTETIPMLAHNYVDMRCTACNAEEKTPFELEASLKESTGKPVLSWNKISGGKKYEVYRATSANGKYTKLTSTTKTTYTDTKASAGKTYFYKIRAVGVKDAYNGEYSERITCQTGCATPSVTVSTDAATGQPKLSWKAVTAADTYRVYRRLSGEESFALIAETASKSYQDRQAPVDCLCQYQVQAVDTHTGAVSAMSTAKQAKSACARPSLKTDITADGKPVISWNEIDGAVAYKVYRSTSSSKNYKLITTVNEPAYSDTSVAAGKSYYYKVVAVGQNTESAQSAYKKATGRCAIPELSVQTASSGKPNLSWNKIEGAKKYEIYRSTNGGSFKKLTTTTKITYTDSKASGGSAYTYKVRALGASSSGNSPFSLTHSSAVACTAPALTVKVDATTGKPGLSWKKVTGAVSYEIYRSENGGEFTLVATQSGVSYKDTKAVPGTVYSYQVLALGKRDVFCSDSSAVKTVSAVCAQPKPKGKLSADGKPVLIWSDVAGADAYVIYRSTSRSSGYQELDRTEVPAFTDTTAKKNKTYYYKITAVAESTESARSGYVKLKAKK